MSIKPWGPIDWLLPRTKVQSWHLITSSSFEERCVGVLERLQHSEFNLTSTTLLRLTNPPSDLWTDAQPAISKNVEAIHALLGQVSVNEVEGKLLAMPSSLMRPSSLNPDNCESVILDITTIPKRFFLFAMQQLMRSKIVKNLVVTYTKAREYPEAALCENALPPTALQGFARMSTTEESPRLIVGVGYMPLSVEELVEQAKNAKLDFVFPFPPASPAFRRNWDLLAMLMPTDPPRNTEIHRVHGMDAFEICERVKAWGESRNLDLLPLGPKPHALGMAMAAMRLDGHAEVLYSQPQAYRPNYSTGVAVDASGQPQIVAYCLKLDGRDLF